MICELMIFELSIYSLKSLSPTDIRVPLIRSTYHLAPSRLDQRIGADAEIGLHMQWNIILYNNYYFN